MGGVEWGLDEDIIRAQIAKESWWYQTSGGDYTTDQSACHPLLRTSSGPCPESIGLVQVRYLYHSQAFVNNNAINSSAHNLDYTYSLMRACFDGESTWLNTVERGRNTQQATCGVASASSTRDVGTPMPRTATSQPSSRTSPRGFGPLRASATADTSAEFAPRHRPPQSRETLTRTGRETDRPTPPCHGG